MADTELWEAVFAEKRMMWGVEPTRSAVFASDYFARKGVTDVLIPGVGYGRNAKPFLERKMAVTGIEISETAIGLARSELGLDIAIYHVSVHAFMANAAGARATARASRSTQRSERRRGSREHSCLADGTSSTS